MSPRKAALIAWAGIALVAAHVAGQEARTLDRHLASRILGEERTITINLPANYDIARRRYPVVYLLDGEQRPLFNITVAATAFDLQLDAIDHAIPPHIVVGIEQRSRGVEFGRSADPFLQYLKEEVVAGIDREFRTSPLRILVGHSLAGRFAIEALCGGGRTFAAAIAISPAITDSAGLRQVIACLIERARADSGRLTHLFLSSGNRIKDATEAQFRPYQLALRAWLADSAPSSLRWKFLDLPDVSHSQTAYFSIPDAVWFVHHRAIWDLPQPTIDSLFAGAREPDAVINEFYSGLSSRVGFAVPVDSKWLRILAVLEGSKGRWAEAIAAARRAVELYPEDMETHLTLADALARSRDRPAARKALEAAVRIATRLAGPERIRSERLALLRRRLQALDQPTGGGRR
jgi:predicted alpha/beta superfamily hydrolase